MNDPFDLERFVDAQATAYPKALAEIRRGSKATHWMWFIFPQLGDLGHSATARYFGIGSIAEARAYLDHPLLGPRYLDCVEALQALDISDPVAAFGAVDAKKLRSSLSLFESAGGPPVLGEAIDRWFHGIRDETTLRFLRDGQGRPDMPSEPA
ncbi:DUF1810 domain-containing protein [Sphingomonas colocasiae]|uniref:DUF1810 domain-containing protein n=1 Tax=Sphingomonas colocasiae TaxID=1848973 RepID=A0ABS7PQ44_9SPHN|nr:DUF1810 domain-containing protein [Sphingomonas colocasiae]MBY8823452.1 DUF1810 domain-containing protein [Sphingomonas colocasiae]